MGGPLLHCWWSLRRSRFLLLFCLHTSSWNESKSHKEVSTDITQVVLKDRDSRSKDRALKDVETSCSDVSTACLALPRHVLPAPHLPNPHFRSGISIASLSSEGRLSESVRQALLPLALSAPLSYASRSVVTSQNLPPTFDIAYTGFRRAVWSPAGAAGLQRCVLALLTSDHRLLLACGRGRRLRPCLSLGRRWAQYLEANDWPLSSGTQDQDNPQGDNVLHVHDESICLNSDVRRNDSAAKNDLKSVNDCGSFKKFQRAASVSQGKQGCRKSLQGASSACVDNEQSAIDETCNTTASSATSDAGPVSRDGAYISDTTRQSNTGESKRRRTEGSSKSGKRSCNLAMLAARRTVASRSRYAWDLPNRGREEQLISEIELHICRLSQLAIKLVCWCPLVTQCPETGLWESDLLHLSLSGHAVVWRVTAGEREACAPLIQKDQTSSGGSSRSGRQKANENAEKEHDGSNFLDATVTATFDLCNTGASCARWAVIADSTGTSVNPSSRSEPTSSTSDNLPNLPDGGDNVQCRYSSSKDTNDEPKSPTEETAEGVRKSKGDLEVLVVVTRAMSLSVLLLTISQRRCQLMAAAHAYVSKMNITGISVVDPEHLYCSTRDGRLLHLSVVFHRSGLVDPPEQASPVRKRKRECTVKLKNFKENESSSHSPDLVVGSPARTHNGVQETVDVHRIEDRSDYTEHTEVISLQNVNGKVSRLNVVCIRYHGFNTSLSLRRKLMKEHTSDGASIVSMTTSPNSVFYATVESLRVPYDHLVMRESSRLTVCLVSNIAELQRHLTTSAYLQPLHLMHDFLAACRILAVEGTVLSLVPLLEKIPSLLDGNGVSTCTSKDSSESEASEQDTLRVLQLLLWLVRLYARLKADPASLPPTFKSWDSLQQRLLELLLLPWLERVVRVYHDNELWQHQELKPLVKASLSLMCDYLVVRGPSEHSARAMTVLLRLGGGTREQCAVGRCELMVELSNLTEARCADGHALPRCCVSLLPVLRAETCQLCATVLHRQPADALCGGEALCSFCGGAMEGTAVSSSAAAARVTREGSKLLPKTSLVLLNSKNRKGKAAVNAQRI
ncbi:Transcription factor IIIC putative zinc-finger [Trinorchestia longiramus]|nr:Transcription factor IIIC putative zinc-finger [Trinorchestia longiramus]